MSDDFRTRYGPWGLVAGASVGLGAQFATQLAARGLHLCLIARREEPLQALAERLRADFGVEVRSAALDLARPDLEAPLRDLTGDVEIGLLVYNAAATAIGPFAEQKLADKLRIVDVNCRGPLLLAHQFGRPMLERGRGGIVLMSSLAGFQGTPLVATYAASKAYLRVLAEGLWAEFSRSGVDVLACHGGAIATPNFEQSQPRGNPRPMAPRQVVSEALAALGRGPGAIPGWTNRVAGFALGRLLPRRVAVRIMGRATRSLYGP